ncbi:MAG: hypothetical protein PHI78_02905 [Clostridia bacterium]|nr:hypothetical protein [Clostridia bacterium]
MIDYEKCPKCEINFMKKGEACCDLCKQQMSKKEIIGNGAKRKPARTNMNTHFIIKNKRLIRGYELYDVQNGQERLLGEILSDWQKNKLAHLQACMHFAERFFDEYGEWHLVRINGERVMFEKIESKIKDQKQIEIDIDTW